MTADATATLLATSGQQRDAWRRKELPEIEQVAAGVWAIPVPVARLPIRFTYAYLIRSRTQAVLIDPGARSVEGERVLADAFAVIGLPMDALTGIVVTHYHFDHWEAADDLARQTGAWIGIGVREQEWIDRLTFSVLSSEAAAERFRRLGVPSEQAERFAAVEDYRFTRQHARPDLLLEHGDLLPIDGASLRVVSTPGHSPGHICVYDEDRGLLFSGDHVLPRITPHIARNPFGESDPLAQYLASLDVVARLGDLEVLPAHEYRFRGLEVRVRELKDDVAARRSEVQSARVRTPGSTPWDVARELTWSREWSQFGIEAQRMAVVETAAFFAHLNAV